MSKEEYSAIEILETIVADGFLSETNAHRAQRIIASKATEEGELPALPQEIEVGGEGWDFEDFKSQKTFSVDHMHEYARWAIAADRASRQVANKAEVEPVAFMTSDKKMLVFADVLRKLQFNPAGMIALYATPPANTGASTVLTDELRCATELAWHLWKEHYSATAPEWQPLPDLYGVLSQIDNMISGWKAGSPVVAQAAQVAVPEGWSIERVGDAIHIKRADGRWCGYMQGIDSPAHRLTHEFLSAMLAATPSPAKESK